MSEQSLEITPENLEVITEALGGNFYWKDIYGNYLGCNTLLLKTLSFKKKSDLINKNDKELWSNYAESLAEHDEKVIKTQRPHIFEENISLDNKKMYFIAIKVPLVDSQGKIIGIIGNSIDVTLLNETKKKVEKNFKNLEQFHYLFNHQLLQFYLKVYNPISNVILLLNFLKEETNSLQEIFYAFLVEVNKSKNLIKLMAQISQRFKKISEYQHKTLQEAQRALTSLSSLITWHDLVLNGVETESAEIDLNLLLVQAIEESKKAMHSENEVKLLIDPTIPTELSLDQTNLSIVLKIFLENALRFSYPTQAIIVNVTPLTQDYAYCLKITIQDFGGGMSQNQINHLFKPSVREEKGKVNMLYGKPSLRLAQAKLRVEAMDGKMFIESAPHQGTRVILIVPTSLKKITPPTDALYESKLKLLLIEDDVETQALTNLFLQELGCQVDIAGTGQQAIELAHQNAYDVILLDITLPDMNGFEVIKNIKKTDIFIALTSHGAAADLNRYSEEGMAAYLKKPFDKVALKECLLTVLKIKNEGDDC